MRLSIVICSYNMHRELPRTLISLSPWFQEVDPGQYEILIVQNGGELIDPHALELIAPNIRAITPSAIVRSPCMALNEAVKKHALGDFVMMVIDGARIHSNSIVRTTFEAIEALYSDGVFFYAPAYHLGWDRQSITQTRGYNQVVEDIALETVNWLSNPRKLFNISARAASNRGVFKLPAEANTLIIKRRDWIELGGFNEGFSTPGGGLCNLELFGRFCYWASSIVCLFSEGSFHQFHGGASTNAVDKASQRRREQKDLDDLNITINTEGMVEQCQKKLRFYSGSSASELCSVDLLIRDNNQSMRFFLPFLDRSMFFRNTFDLRRITNSTNLKFWRPKIASILKIFGLDSLRRYVVDKGF